MGWAVEVGAEKFEGDEDRSGTEMFMTEVVAVV